jgi:KTSC domain
MTIEMTPVTSSNLEAIGYSAVDKKLRVHFKNKTAYEYHDVPEHEFHAFKAAESPGRHFFTRIRGQYQHVKIAS